MSFFIYESIIKLHCSGSITAENEQLTPKHTTAPFNQKETLQTNSTPVLSTHRNAWLMVRCLGDKTNQPT